MPAAANWRQMLMRHVVLPMPGRDHNIDVTLATCARSSLRAVVPTMNRVRFLLGQLREHVEEREERLAYRSRTRSFLMQWRRREAHSRHRDRCAATEDPQVVRATSPIE
jgi:hypothetical protein